MAILKYTNKNGEIVTVNSYKINNVIVSQEKGQSTADVMSQKAVTDEIELLNSTVETKANKSDIPTKLSELSNDSGYLTTHQDISTKADIASVYTKAEADNKYQPKGNYLTAHQDISKLATKQELTDAINAIPPTDLSDYYNKSEVDNLIDNVDVSEQLREFAKIWSGTEDEYNALTETDNNTIYIII